VFIEGGGWVRCQEVEGVQCSVVREVVLAYAS